MSQNDLAIFSENVCAKLFNLKRIGEKLPQHQKTIELWKNYLPPWKKTKLKKLWDFLKQENLWQNIPFSISDAKKFQNFTHRKKCVVWWFLWIEIRYIIWEVDSLGIYTLLRFFILRLVINYTKLFKFFDNPRIISMVFLRLS